MAYWHIRIHPSGRNQEKWEKEFNEELLLKEKSMIGIGVALDSPRLEAFKNEMKVNDIVLVRHNRKPIALVQVVDKVIDRRRNDFKKLDWFRYSRKVKVLAFSSDNLPNFSSASVQVLRKSDDENTKTYKYIDIWYKSILPKEDSYTFDKIKQVYISKYKMFNDFNFNLCDANDTPLAIIVIAGKNGTGKTSLLEYLSKYSGDSEKDFLEISKIGSNENYISSLMKKGESGIIETREEYKNSIKYMNVEVNSVGNIEEYIIKDYMSLAEEYDSFKKSLKEIQDFISKALADLELDFNISKINYNDRKVFFKKKNNSVEFTVNELSTGEKTLLSKVLSLFFEKVKNKIILIDEPELSLHPSWQNKVLKLYENFAIKNNCQIIIATHSPHIIASAKNKYLRFFEKDKEGKIRVINDLEAYGRDVEWVLQRMGVKNLRVSEILERFTHCQQLLNEKKYDEAEECINDLEEEIGQHDTKVMSLRNALFFERY